MRRFTSILMLLAMFAVVSWGQTTETIRVSTSIDSPENVYLLKNGNNWWMTQHTAPTQTLANAAKFAFFEVADKENTYKIYCVDTGKWLSYAKASGYSNGTNFVELVDEMESAEYWKAVIQDGYGNLGDVYCIAPYNTTGVAAKYMNWYNGTSSNPFDNTSTTIGLWSGNATGDAGSSWIIQSPDLVTYTTNQTMVRIKSVTATDMYLTITEPEKNNQDQTGVQFAEKITDVSAALSSQIFYLKPTGNDVRVNRIQTVNGGYKLQYLWSWGYKASTNDNGNASVHTIEAADDYYMLHTDKGYVGSNSNATAAGSYIYSNHGTSNPNIKWQFEPLSEEEVADIVAWMVADTKAEYTTWKSRNVGNTFGKYTVSDAAALEVAETALNAATSTESALEARAQCIELYTLNDEMVVGKYYRIQSTTRGTYTGLDGATLNMKNKADDANDPTFVWQYVQDGENFYLKNVYSGLYPQEVVSGGANTTKVGLSKEKAFTYELYAAPVDDITQWNVFFGGSAGQVNIEENGNVNYWNGDNAHHHIYEVEAPSEALCEAWYVANPITAPAKINVDENADEIVSPNEFAAPDVINETIDRFEEAIAGALTIPQRYEVLVDFQATLSPYVNALNANGALLSIAYTPKAEWGTIIVPINVAKPEGWTMYTCATTEGNVLTLAEATEGFVKNTPYIINVDEAKWGTTYQLIGYSKGAATTNQTSGLLTGVLEEGTTVPAGSYILSKYNDKMGFYRVADGTTYPASKYKCYLTLSESEARYAALFFDGTETGIDGIVEAETGNSNGVIYNMAGQRLTKMQKGLNIVGGKIVIK